MSWWLAWTGSLLLWLLTVTGNAFAIPRDLSIQSQGLRPWLLMQTTFVGYNCLTSLFYFIDLNGFYYLAFDPFRVQASLLPYAAAAQRFYFLAHIALVLGIGVGMRWRPTVEYRLTGLKSVSGLLIRTAIGAAIGIYVFRAIPGFSQFAEKMRTLATVAAAVSLGIAYRERIKGTIWPPIVANVIILLLALSSGWKSEVLVLVLLNASVFYSAKPIATIFFTVLILVSGLILLPPLVAKIRKDSWERGETSFAALYSSIQSLTERSVEETTRETWEFMVERMSEETLFVRYIQAVPDRRPFYGTELIMQAAISPIPRIIWTNKPNLELLVGKRVLELEVIKSLTNVSAKPQIIVDGYLTYGGLGVAIFLFVYGYLASFLSRMCEACMGGYLTGGVVFNGLFGFMWNGTCIEFFVNAMLWSVVLVILLFQYGRIQNKLIPA